MHLHEVIHGDSAIVYHRTPLTVNTKDVTPEEALQNEPILFAWDHSDPSILDSMEWGFKSGAGDYYGRGFYSVFNPDQTIKDHGGNYNYGKLLIKFRVLNISNYLFLSFDQFKKTTKYQGDHLRYNEDNFVFKQLLDAGVPNAYGLSYDFTTYLIGECYISDLNETIADVATYFDGLVYTGGENDGDVLVAYDTDNYQNPGKNVHKGVLKGIWPLGFSLNDGASWTKIPISQEIATIIRQHTLSPNARTIQGYKTIPKKHRLEIRIPEQNISDFSEEDLSSNDIMLLIDVDGYFNVDLIRSFLKYKPIVQANEIITLIYTNEGGDLSHIFNALKHVLWKNLTIKSDSLIWFSEQHQNTSANEGPIEYSIKGANITVREKDIPMLATAYTSIFQNGFDPTRGPLKFQYLLPNNSISVTYVNFSITINAQNTEGLEHIITDTPSNFYALQIDLAEYETNILGMQWLQDILKRGMTVFISDAHKYTTWYGNSLLTLSQAEITSQTKFVGYGHTNVDVLKTKSWTQLEQVLNYIELDHQMLIQCNIQPGVIFTNDVVQRLIDTVEANGSEIQLLRNKMSLEEFDKATAGLSQESLNYLERWANIPSTDLI